MDAYLEAAGILGDARSPLFRTSLARTGRLTANALTENAALRIVKRRAAAGGEICCHTFRATEITAQVLNGGEVSGVSRRLPCLRPSPADPERHRLARSLR